MLVGIQSKYGAGKLISDVGVSVENMKMRTVVVSTLCALTLLAAPAAQARGCIKGAIVGGLAGHVAHHGLLGAAAGCVAGRALSHHRPVPAMAAPMAPAVSPVYR